MIVTSELTSPSGIDLSYLDPAVRVQDDLFAHVNGAWLQSYEIPADRAVDGAFRTLYDQAELDVKAIIQQAAWCAGQRGPQGRRPVCQFHGHRAGRGGRARADRR